MHAVARFGTPRKSYLCAGAPSLVRARQVGQPIGTVGKRALRWRLLRECQCSGLHMIALVSLAKNQAWLYGRLVGQHVWGSRLLP